MGRVHIRGLVRLANDMRRDWAAGDTAFRQALLGKLHQTMQQADVFLRDQGLKPAQLPAPSRRAYAFLQHLLANGATMIADAGETSTAVSCRPPKFVPPEQMRPVESVTFKGLGAYLKDLLGDLAMQASKDQLNHDAMHGVIVSTRQRLDRQIEARAISAAQLKPASRELVAWFRWFSEPGAFKTYVSAVRRAQQVLARVVGAQLKWRMPLLIQFVPTSRLYHWHVKPAGSVILAASPWVALQDADFAAFGRCMMRDRAASRTVADLLVSDRYQSLARSIQGTVEEVRNTRGFVRDLRDSFERVNRDWFQGQMSLPRLAWTRSLTGRVFGTYERVSDTVCISSTLDHPDVPLFVLDHVMHHELLHKKHGVDWKQDRRHVHTPAFRTEEKLFSQYAQACTVLNGLARRL